MLEVKNMRRKPTEIRAVRVSDLRLVCETGAYDQLPEWVEKARAAGRLTITPKHVIIDRYWHGSNADWLGQKVPGTKLFFIHEGSMDLLYEDVTQEKDNA